MRGFTLQIRMINQNTLMWVTKPGVVTNTGKDIKQ
jgi:hypothetical protein